MDVDTPTAEEAMETDPPLPQPPQLERKASSADPEGDEEMGGEEMYDEEGDVVIAEGDEEEGRIDPDGDITPDEAEAALEGDEYAAEGDVEIVEEAEEDSQETEEVVNDTGLVGEAEVAVSDNPVVGGTDTVLTAPSTVTTGNPAPEIYEETVDEHQAEEGNAPVEAQPIEGEGSDDQRPELDLVGDTEEVVAFEETPHVKPASKATDIEEVFEIVEEHEDDHESGDVGIHQDDEVDEFEHLTYENLPPIILHLPNAQRALFNPFVAEDGSSPPIWFAEKVQEFSEGTLTLLWSAIRTQLDEEGAGNESDELVITEKLTDLKMGDVSLLPL